MPTDIYELLDLNRNELVERIDNLLRPACDDYSGRIADRIADQVAWDIYDTRDENSNFTDGDLKLAIGRTLADYLSLEH